MMMTAFSASRTMFQAKRAQVLRKSATSLNSIVIQTTKKLVGVLGHVQNCFFVKSNKIRCEVFYG